MSIFMLLYSLLKKVAESALEPRSLSLPWEVLGSFFYPFFFFFLFLLFVCMCVCLESISLVAELVVWQHAAEVVTSKHKVSLVGIMLEDWVLLHCAVREELGTATPILLVVCKVITVPCLGFLPKEPVSSSRLQSRSRLSYTQCRQLKDQGFFSKMGHKLNR